MKCPICSGSWPTLEEHHVIPREYGGVDGPTVFLCGQCHSAAHSTANNRFRKDGEDIQFFPDACLKKAEPFVQAIMQARLAYESRHPSQKKVPKRLTVSLRDPNVLVRLHKLKVDQGFTNLEKFMNALLERITAPYK